MQNFEGKQQLNQGLFFCIVKGDIATAQKCHASGANPNAIFQIEKDKYISSFNVLIQRTARIGKTKGPNCSQYKEHMNLIKSIIKNSALECKCLHEHKCPLYLALEELKISEESQILEGKCDLIRFLLLNGASVRFQEKAKKQKAKEWRLKWFDLEGVRSYLITKNFSYIETIV